MLHPKPALRPSISRIRAHPFFLPLSDDNDGVTMKDNANNLSSTITAKTKVVFKVIRLFGEMPLYDVYFSYRRSCPADKVTDKGICTFTIKSCVCRTHSFIHSFNPYYFFYINHHSLTHICYSIRLIHPQ